MKLFHSEFGDKYLNVKWSITEEMKKCVLAIESYLLSVLS